MVVSVQRQPQRLHGAGDVEVVGQVKLPGHLVGTSQDEEVPGRLTAVVIAVVVPLTHLWHNNSELLTDNIVRSCICYDYV